MGLPLKAGICHYILSFPPLRDQKSERKSANRPRMDIDMSNLKMPHSFIALLVAAAVSACAQDAAAIQKKLVSEFALTQPTADLSDIVTAGAILVLQKSNLMMAPVSGTNFYQNTYRDGKITQNAAGKVTSALGRFSRLPGASAPNVPATRTYVTGEKMWVTKIEVKDDAVVLDLYTDAVADVRYKAALRIPLPKGATVDQADKLVAEVFKVQPQEDAKQDQAPAAGQQAPPAAPAAAEQAPPPIAPPPPPADNAPVPDIAPPPPPADQAAPPPQTISLGQTPDQVIAILGQPQKIVKLAAKQTYYYKDLKVIFTAGKVTDVQ
jgi:hypothetical protein